uniref:Uncharacterized protein n=2 Tax=Ixodes ricinus TaxID=34613 RepID=V5HWU5_IXORI
MKPELAPMPTKSELFCSPPETKLYKEEGNIDRRVKTCQNGTCTGDYKEDECKRKMLAVYSRANVVETCTLKCNNGSYVQVENGTMCALRTSIRRSGWLWFSSEETIIEEIGICHNGTCVHREETFFRNYQ